MKSDSIDRRIGELEDELTNLRRQKVALLQEELSKLQADLKGIRSTDRTEKAEPAAKAGKVGRPAKATKGWASELDPTLPAGKAPRKTRGRKNKQSDEEVIEKLRKVVAAAGKEGISARAAAIKAGVLYPRAIKAMNDSFIKSGGGKGTRYTIK